MNIDTHICLVSAQAAPNLLPMLDEDLSNADKKRAQDLRIKVIEAEQIQTLKSHLKDWINH